MSFVAHVLEFFLIAGLVVVVGLTAAFLVGRSYVRRHWRLLHGHVAVRGILATLALLAAGRERFAGRATPEDLSRGATSRVRRRLRVAVEDAEIAVAHAESRDAPVAELPAVCRSLSASPTSWTGCSGWSAGCPRAPAAPTCAARWPR